MTLADAKRKYIVRGAQTNSGKRGSIGFPNELFDDFEDSSDLETLWRVTLQIQQGLLPVSTVSKYFRTEKEAHTFVASHPVNSDFDYTFPQEIVTDVNFDAWTQTGFFPVAAGSPESFIIYETLKSAGITDGLNTSQHILEALGSQRTKQLSELYGENWQVVARFQYCFNNLPHSSLAYIAAAHDFCYYILEDDFKAGYLLRDLEVLLHGVEETASKTIATRQKAGQSGSRQSARAKAERRAALFEKVSILIERNPDIAKFGDEAVAKLALEDCENENPSLWKQGRGQVSDYLGEIRRGDAGPDMQKRYQAIFGSKPPKRFKG